MTKDNDDAILIETGRMAARLIHDFKNQLGGLKLYAAYLQKRFADHPEGLEIAEKIAQGLNEMADQAALLNQMARPLELRMETSDLAMMVKQVVSRLQSIATAKRVGIALNLIPDSLQFSFDSRQMGAALESIIARAVDVTPENGEVEISMSRMGEALQLEIKDNGFTPDDAQFLNFFDPLAGARLNKGALGLAMARRIIEKHGGWISARANTSAGTIVEVRMNTG